MELDSIHHLANWQPIEPDQFLAEVEAIAATESWVIDGNYRAVVCDGPVWQRADTVVWLDLPRHVVIRQVSLRTIRRVFTREKLWNGNREPIRNVLSWAPERSIIRWSWTQHDKYRDRYASAMTTPEMAHAQFVRLRSHDESVVWLRGLA